MLCDLKFTTGDRKDRRKLMADAGWVRTRNRLLLAFHGKHTRKRGRGENRRRGWRTRATSRDRPGVDLPNAAVKDVTCVPLCCAPYAYTTRSLTMTFPPRPRCAVDMTLLTGYMSVPCTTVASNCCLSGNFGGAFGELP
jgi:hypothetical protein